MVKEAVRVEEKHPLDWAKEAPRTLIGDRRSMKSWKKPLSHYKTKLIEELRKVGATEVQLSFHDDSKAALDPGVTVYFSKAGAAQDTQWQAALGIDSPLPSVAEINAAFQGKAKKYHPDNLDTGDVKIFQQFAVHRDNAIRYVTGKRNQEQKIALACDRYTEVRWNINALAISVSALRRLEEFGIAGFLERVFRGFRTQIEHQPNSEVIHQ
jgi:hypothetical protein